MKKNTCFYEIQIKVDSIKLLWPVEPNRATEFGRLRESHKAYTGCGMDAPVLWRLVIKEAVSKGQPFLIFRKSGRFIHKRAV